MRAMTDDYEVGFGKPPQHTRFKPGQSGNPNGRPKGTNNLKTDLAEELHELIIVHEGGTAKAVSKQRAMLKALIAKAVQADARAAAIITDMMYRLLHEDEGDDASRGPSPDDKSIIEAFVQRLLRQSDPTPEETESGQARNPLDSGEQDDDGSL
jgi:hypothetical protein